MFLSTNTPKNTTIKSKEIIQWIIPATKWYRLWPLISRLARKDAIIMKNPMKNIWFLVGFIGLFTVGSNFTVQMFRAFGGNQTIYWTNNSMKLPINSTGNEFELFINEIPLKEHLSNGSLLAVDTNGKHYRIVSKDITARINNWYKVKSTTLTYALITGVMLGSVLTMILVGIIQVYIKKE